MARKTTLVYTTRKDSFFEGRAYADPSLFSSARSGFKRVIVEGDWPAVVDAYAKLGIECEVVDAEPPENLYSDGTVSFGDIKMDLGKGVLTITSGADISPTGEITGFTPPPDGSGAATTITADVFACVDATTGQVLGVTPSGDDELNRNKDGEDPNAAEIPENWQELGWDKLRSLAAKVTDKKVINKAEAIAAIKTELARRAKL